MRYEMTKDEAEHMIELVEKAEANGMKFQCFSFRNGKKTYSRELLEAIRDNGGISIGEEEPLLEPHTVVVPASCFCLPENSCTGIAKTIV